MILEKVDISLMLGTFTPENGRVLKKMESINLFQEVLI